MGLREFLGRIRKRTWIIVGSAAAVVVAAVVVAVVVLVPKPQDAAVAQTITSTASLETIEKSVSVSGTLTPTVNESVDFAVSGTVTSVLVQEGQTVAAGTALATVDPIELQADLLAARADLAEAQATLADDEESSSGSDADTARIAADTASVSVAQQTVAAAETAVANATLVAPVAGLVATVGIAVGDSVGGSSGGTGGGTTTSTTAFVIVGTDAWTVNATVGEADVALIAAGNQVELTTDDGTALFGIVREVGMLPSTSSGSVVYPVVIDITGTVEGLYDGVGATASIIYERRTDVLTVPSAAVTTMDGVSTVTVVDADGVETVTTIEIGETDATVTEILSGVVEGDSVLVATFTPGEGNSGQTGGDFGGTLPDGGSFPGGGEMPSGGQGGQGGFGGGPQ